jgi:hypothetical protein
MIIENLNQIKNRRKDDLQKRGNFIEKNARNLGVHLKNKMWMT